MKKRRKNENRVTHTHRKEKEKQQREKYSVPLITIQMVQMSLSYGAACSFLIGWSLRYFIPFNDLGVGGGSGVESRVGKTGRPSPFKPGLFKARFK